MKKYDSFKQIEQTSFVCNVANKGYRWVEEVERETFIVSTGGYEPKFLNSPYLVPKKASTAYNEVEPLQETELFLRFGSLKAKPEDIVKFANRYGLLTEGDDDYIAIHDIPKPVFGESYNRWHKEIGDMSVAIKTWQKLEKQDTVGLFKLSILRDSLPMLYSAKGIRPSEKSLDWSVFTETPGIPENMPAADDVLSDSRNYLTTSFYWKLYLNGGIIPTPVFDESNKPMPYFMPRNLLAAMWLQFFQAVIGERSYKICSICGYAADVTNKRANWRFHSSCANSVRTQRSLLKGKIEDGKATEDEIKRFEELVKFKKEKGALNEGSPKTKD